jgi:hypothetical protein
MPGITSSVGQAGPAEIGTQVSLPFKQHSPDLCPTREREASVTKEVHRVRRHPLLLGVPREGFVLNVQITGWGQRVF